MPKKCLAEDCENNQFGGGFCQRHQWKREKKERTIEPSDYMKAVAAARSSPSYADQTAAYNKRVSTWKKENPFCAFPGCNLPTDHCHHSRGRGEYLNEESTWIPLCWIHHDIVEMRPAMAKEMGLSKSRLENNDSGEET